MRVLRLDREWEGRIFVSNGSEDEDSPVRLRMEKWEERTFFF